MNVLTKIVLVALAVIWAQFGELWAVGAGALSTQMVGAKAQGQGNAFVAQADDASSVYFNPAGMTQLKGTQISIGATLVTPMVERTGAGLPDDKMEESLSYIPNLYITGSLPFKVGTTDENIAVGFGLTAPYGLVTEWKQDSSVRYVSTLSKFELLNANPSIAAKLLPSLSVGFGIDYMNLLNVESKTQTNQAFANGDNSPDGTAKVSGDGDGWGYNLGVLFKPGDNHSFGASYRSQVNMAVDATTELSGLSASSQSNYNFSGNSYSANSKSSLTLPPSVLLGYAYRPNNRWTLVADYEWTGWSVFENQDVTLDETDPSRLGFITGNPNSNTVRTRRNWSDVSAIGLGANFRASEKWQWRGGYSFYEKTVPNATYSPDVPDAPIHVLTAGLTREWEALSFDFALNGWFYSNRTVENTVGNSVGGTVNGKYEAFIPTMAFNVTYRTR